MNNKFASLILGLIVILATTTFTACERVALKNDSQKTELCSTISAPMRTCVYSDQSAEMYTIVDGDVVEPSTITETGVFTWQSILAIVLTLVAGIFGVRWKKATNALKEIAKAMEDNRVTNDEIKKIIAAWQGK